MKNSYCVIMAGGIGSRFWPLSTEQTPKQFLDIMGTGKSFIRATFERFSSIIPIENFYVVTSDIYKQQVLDHIPELDESQILLEPCRRNTAPCIAYASFKINSLNPDANIVVTPADHFVTNNTEFQRIISQALEYTLRNKTLMTIGITPSRAETGYGYIQLDESKEKDVFKIKQFTEKPNLELAKQFIATGDYLWNSGIFIWSCSTILEEFKLQLPKMYDSFNVNIYNTPNEQLDVNAIYEKCQNISIDYGIMESARERSVIPGDFGWSDIGTWGSLYSHLEKDSVQNATTSKKVTFDGSKGCIVNIPDTDTAIIEDLDGYLVAYHNHNLLVKKLDL